MTGRELFETVKQNVVGVVLMGLGCTLALGPYFFDRGEFSGWTLTMGVLLAVWGGILFVGKPAGDALLTISEAGKPYAGGINAVMERAGRRETDPVVATTEVTGEVTSEVTGVVPPIVPADSTTVKKRRLRRTKEDAVPPVAPRETPLPDPPPPAAKRDG